MGSIDGVGYCSYFGITLCIVVIYVIYKSVSNQHEYDLYELMDGVLPKDLISIIKGFNIPWSTNVYRIQREALQEALENRATKTQIANLGLIDDSGMAPSLQPAALKVNGRLARRPTVQQIAALGYI